MVTRVTAVVSAVTATVLALWALLDSPGRVDGRAVVSAAIAGGLIVWLRYATVLTHRTNKEEQWVTSSTR